MKKLVLVVIVQLVAGSAYPCVTCNRPLQNALFDSSFLPNLLTLFSPFLVLGAIVGLLAYISGRRDGTRASEVMAIRTAPLISAVTTIGIGLGGFFDGIVFHQILQWHQMLSNQIPPNTLLNKNINMFWDGIFHAFCFLVTTTGLYLLFNTIKRTDVLVSSRIFNGSLLLGWGIFNVVEGLADHHLYKFHNVREISSNPDLWNFGFLGFSILLLVVGWLLIQRGKTSSSKLSEQASV